MQGLDPYGSPTRAMLETWLDQSHDGTGSPWLSAEQAVALVRHALMRGEGVRMMEAAAYSFHEPPRDTAWEIIGADPMGDNWDDHCDPHRAFDLFRRKLTLARAQGARLKYKLWLSPAGGGPSETARSGGAAGDGA